ncbi:MAG: DUF6428 family protein [Verrucomicrobiota bacterium]
MKLSPIPFTLQQLVEALNKADGRIVRFELPTTSLLTPHVHVTEVARIDKKFVDCGGTLRTDSSCRLQVYQADDTEHRITAAKFAQILAKGAGVLGSTNLPVEVEVEAPYLSVFPVIATRLEEKQVVISLGIRHAACLAEDVCFPVNLQNKSACAPGSGCC